MDLDYYSIMDRQLKEIQDFSKLGIAERIKLVSAWNAMTYNIRKPSKQDNQDFWKLKDGSR